MVLNLLLPTAHVFERLRVRDIVDQDHGVAALVEYPRDVSERFLTCSIPYLQLYQMLLVYPHQVVPEFNSDRNIVLIVEPPFH